MNRAATLFVIPNGVSDELIGGISFATIRVTKHVA